MPPLIIRRNGNCLLPPDAEEYNEEIEKRIRQVQSSNIFIICMLTYECIKVFYHIFYYYDSCPIFSYLCIIAMCSNGFWICSSIFGFLSLNTRQSQLLSRYFYLISLVLVVRLGTYFIIWALMQGYSYNQITKEDATCATLYKGGLMFFQAIVETIFISFLILNTLNIRTYLRNYELSQNQRLRRWNGMPSIL